MDTRCSAASVVGQSTALAAVPVGSNFIQVENADENHADYRSGEKKGLPTGLKGDALHVDPRATTADVRCILSRDIGGQSGV